MKKIALLAALLWLSGCSTLSTSPDRAYQGVQEQQVLYTLSHWSFEGRVAIVSKSDVEQANIHWIHSPQEEVIKLSGPLGQGAVMMTLNAQGVTIDKGGNEIKTSTNPESLIYQEVSLFVPVTFLRSWVVGLPEREEALTVLEGGFEQAGWRILYKAMQPVKSYLLPRHVVVTNDTVKLKLFIDEWNVDGN